MGAWLLVYLVRFSTGLGDSCFGFVLFISKVGRTTGDGVLLPGFIPRNATDVELCRQAKLWFGGLLFDI